MEHNIHPDRHMNLFYSYNQGDCEDNITRALIVLLSRLPARITTEFMKEFMMNHLPPKYEPEDYQYDLQDLDKPLKKDLVKFKRAVLLLLTEAREPIRNAEWPHEDRLRDFARANEQRARRLMENLNRHSRGAIAQLEKVLDTSDVDDDDLQHSLAILQNVLEKGSRPDAWIIDRKNKLCVIIESKKFASFSQDQLDRHRIKLAQDMAEIAMAKPKPECWSEVYKFFKDVYEKPNEYPPDGTTPLRFLTKEFLDYLDICSLSPFTGFRKSQFTTENSSGEEQKCHPWRKAEQFRFLLDQRIRDEDIGLEESRRKREQVPAWELNLTKSVEANLAVDFYGTGEIPLRLCIWWMGKARFRWLLERADHLDEFRSLSRDRNPKLSMGLKVQHRNYAYNLWVRDEGGNPLDNLRKYLELCRRQGLPRRLEFSENTPGSEKRQRVECAIGKIYDQLRDSGLAFDVTDHEGLYEKVTRYRYRYYDLSPFAGLTVDYTAEELEELDGDETVKLVAKDIKSLVKALHCFAKAV